MTTVQTTPYPNSTPAWKMHAVLSFIFNIIASLLVMYIWERLFVPTNEDLAYERQKERAQEEYENYKQNNPEQFENYPNFTEKN